MRALLAVLAVALLVAPASAAKPADKGKKPPKGKPDRAVAVEHLATLPAPAAVSANFKRYGDKRYMFVSTLTGLYVYDVTDGASPQPAGALPLPHFQNEDVSLGGDRLLISTDGQTGSFLVVVDISNPTTPVIERVIKMEILGEGHTASCIDSECRWVWVAGDQLTPGITVLDLDKAAQAGPADADVSFFGFRVPGTAPAVVVGEIKGFEEFGGVTHDV